MPARRIRGFAWRFGTHAGAYGAWLLLLSNFFATMATAVPAGIYTLALVAPAHVQDPSWTAGVGAVWILASAALLYAGVRPTALVTFVALALELGVLIAAAVAAALHAPVPAHAIATSTPLPAAFGVAGFVTAMTLAVWMSDGWEVSASTSEEVEGLEHCIGSRRHRRPVAFNGRARCVHVRVLALRLVAGLCRQSSRRARVHRRTARRRRLAHRDRRYRAAFHALDVVDDHFVPFAFGLRDGARRGLAASLGRRSMLASSRSGRCLW